MVQAYRLLIQTMHNEFGICYPLHLGVTEAGDGEDGRIKSAIGIGSLLEDGIGDTIRVSLTEDPEFEIPVCRDLVKRYQGENTTNSNSQTASVKLTVPENNVPAIESLSYNPFEYQRRKTFAVDNIGGTQVPVVVSDMSKIEKLLLSIYKVLGILTTKPLINGISPMLQPTTCSPGINCSISHCREHLK